jgi:HAD superfamily hydrolase (TIGR01509 family)
MAMNAVKPSVEAPPRPALRAVPAVDEVAFDLDVAGERWQLALDAAQRALAAATFVLPAAGLGARQRELAAERQLTEAALARLARETGAESAPWLSSTPVDAGMLGLAPSVRACLFDMDEVLTDSGTLHAWAWSEVFDPLLQRLSERAGWAFRPFDRNGDYLSFLDGRPRVEGIHTFLVSRGIRLPEGRPGDAPTAETACGLARLKGEKLELRLAHRGVGAVPGARRYLEAARRAGLACAVVSASANTLPMLQVAGLLQLVDERVDAEVMRAEGLRARPAPDLLLAACRRVGVDPETTVTFTHSPAGVAAGHSAGLTVFGVGHGERGRVLHEFGADVVVGALGELLDPRIRERVQVLA